MAASVFFQCLSHMHVHPCLGMQVLRCLSARLARESRSHPAWAPLGAGPCLDTLGRPSHAVPLASSSSKVKLRGFSMRSQRNMPASERHRLTNSFKRASKDKQLKYELHYLLNTFKYIIIIISYKIMLRCCVHRACGRDQLARPCKCASQARRRLRQRRRRSN